ncbi:MAG: enoyl-CoA hydratase/isomerase family protein [Pirellulales bacterium]
MITVKKNAPSGTIILDRPRQCNAISLEMLRQLRDAFSDLHQEKTVRSVILSASGSVFCAGVDLKEWQETSTTPSAEEQWHEYVEELQALVDTMLRFPKPIIAAVDGAAIGAGFTLVLACDLVVASQRATFSLPSPKRGLVSGLAVPLLTFRLGGSMASRLLLGLETIDIDVAHRVGLVHHVVSPEQIWVRSHQWAQDLAESSHESMQLTKRLLNEMVGESVTMLLASGASATATACTTDNAKEGLQAFVEKRPPRWK